MKHKEDEKKATKFGSSNEFYLPLHKVLERNLRLAQDVITTSTTAGGQRGEAAQQHENQQQLHGSTIEINIFEFSLP